MKICRRWPRSLLVSSPLHARCLFLLVSEILCLFHTFTREMKNVTESFTPGCTVASRFPFVLFALSVLVSFLRTHGCHATHFRRDHDEITAILRSKKTTRQPGTSVSINATRYELQTIRERGESLRHRDRETSRVTSRLIFVFGG